MSNAAKQPLSLSPRLPPPPPLDLLSHSLARPSTFTLALTNKTANHPTITNTHTHVPTYAHLNHPSLLAA